MRKITAVWPDEVRDTRSPRAYFVWLLHNRYRQRLLDDQRAAIEYAIEELERLN